MKVTDLAVAYCPKWMFPILFALLRKEIFAEIKFSTYNLKNNDVLK